MSPLGVFETDLDSITDMQLELWGMGSSTNELTQSLALADLLRHEIYLEAEK